MTDLRLCLAALVLNKWLSLDTERQLLILGAHQVASCQRPLGNLALPVFTALPTEILPGL